MSRAAKLTTADIINSGDYLEPDFDPTTLTIPLLSGVLGFHNIPYPTPASKPKLVKVFNDEIKSRAAALKRDHIKRTNSAASDDGILDGVTGEPLRQNQPIERRRSSRRVSRAPPDPEVEELPKRPEPVKRRRSSAQPSFGRPSTSKIAIEPALAEESESEIESQPARKVGRRKNMPDTAGPTTRRVSNHAEDSGWEDNNIFQSGVDSPSPTRPSPTKPRLSRKSVGPRKSRISASAPPEAPPSPIRTFPQPPLGAPISPPQTKFNPQIPQFTLTNRTPQPSPSGPRLSGLPYTSPFLTGRQEPLPPPPESDDELNVISAHKATIEETQDNPEEVIEEEATDIIQDYSPPEEPTPEEQVIAVSQRIADGGKHAVTRYVEPPKPVSASRVMGYFSLIVLVVSTILVYQPASAQFGYCDKGTDSNVLVRQMRERRLEVEACQKQALVADDNGEPSTSKACPPLPISALVVPERCTPCPGHGTCTKDTVVCDTGYILRSHPLLFFLPAPSTPRDSNISFTSLSFADMCYKSVSKVLDGLPALGSVALPPRCVEDPNRKRNIGALGKAIESLLGQERGRRLCAGEMNRPISEADGGDAKKWGVDLEILREVMKKKTRRPELLATFDDTFDEAIQQLIQYGGAITGEDRQYHRFIAHQTPDLTWDCMITVKSRELWQEWKVSVFGILFAVIFGKYAQSRATQSRKDSKRVTELVQVVLDTLRNQEMQHHVDPVTYPQPYLSSLQLRDLILQDEHSVLVRSRLWERVEKVVEGNANVRANLEEVGGGDEMRIWTWVGSGRGSRLEGSPLGANDENDLEEYGPEDPKEE